jgi:MoaA/NifB/PqqE/SkfB family radical SAM enzyme
MKTINVNAEQIKLFNTLALETGALCNRACVFCPNHHNERPDEYMPWDTIRKIAEELAELRYAGRITTYIYNEPFRDKRVLGITRYLADTVPKAHIMLSTNGDYFKRKEDIAAVYEAGVCQLLINVYSAADGSGNTAKEAKGVQQARARATMFETWLHELGVNTARSVYAPAPRNARIGRVEHKYGITKDTKRLARFELQNRSGNIGWFADAVPEPLPKMCVRPWRVLNINWRGEGVLCCNDYHAAVPLGNVATDSLVDMWNSEAINRYRLFLQNKRRDLPLCNTCDYGTGSYPHMVERVTFSQTKDRQLLK